jgi:general secretion pathway protein C
VPKATLAAVLATPAKFITTARVVPAMKNGQPDGIKLYAIRPSSVFAHIGLQNGDTIQTINGNDLGDLSKALDSYAKLKVAHAFVIEIVRRGRPLTVTITEK